MPLDGPRKIRLQAAHNNATHNAKVASTVATPAAACQPWAWRRRSGEAARQPSPNTTRVSGPLP